MNTGQMLITVAAIALLSLVILRVNTNLLSTDNVLSMSKVELLATSLATSLVEEANSKSFDAVTFTSPVSSSTSLTAVSDLGSETGEVYPVFNDFDDFKNFRTNPKIDSVEIGPDRYLVFHTYCDVNYISESNPEINSTVRTWYKKLDVKVTSDAMRDESSSVQDTIRLSTIFSYWYFR